jgi:hypothetical protein
MICVTISQFTILTHLPEITDRLEYHYITRSKHAQMKNMKL